MQNNFIDAVIPGLELDPYHIAILMVILRETLGRGRQSARLSFSDFQRVIKKGFSRRQLIKKRDELENDLELISVIKHYKRTNEYSLTPLFFEYQSSASGAPDNKNLVHDVHQSSASGAPLLNKTFFVDNKQHFVVYDEMFLVTELAALGANSETINSSLEKFGLRLQFELERYLHAVKCGNNIKSGVGWILGSCGTYAGFSYTGQEKFITRADAKKKKEAAAEKEKKKAAAEKEKAAEESLAQMDREYCQEFYLSLPPADRERIDNDTYQILKARKYQGAEFFIAERLAGNPEADKWPAYYSYVKERNDLLKVRYDDFKKNYHNSLKADLFLQPIT